MATPLLDQMVDLLRGSALLETLPASELRELATRVRRSSHDAGEMIFRKGEDGTGMGYGCRLQPGSGPATDAGRSAAG